MGACVFKEEEYSTSAIVRGTTAFAEKANACIKETGVFFPPSHSFSSDSINVILWFHGYFVHNVKDLIHPEDGDMDMKLRQSINSSKKDVVLIAPWLGYKDHSGGSLGLGTLGEGEGCGAYLKDVLTGLARFGSGSSDPLTIDNLIVAGHSAGGAMMRDASKHLGKDYTDALRECWGFDCLYDDEYVGWARTNPGSKKFIHFGKGSGKVHAFNLMKEVYGSPKQPVPDNKRPPNLNVAPVVDTVYSTNDNAAFQSLKDMEDWGPYSSNPYADVRKATDPLLDKTAGAYWDGISPKLTSHFQMVRDMFGPRITQSMAL